MQIKNVAAIGGGVIGGGWIARFLLMGYDVNVFDPDADAERKINEVLSNARKSLPVVYDHCLPEEGALIFHRSLSDAVKDADWITESVPERLELKQSLYKEIQKHCPEHAVITSSTSGFKPSELQEGSSRPQQIIVAHPFNPVYLIPLVELVGDQQVCDQAREFLDGLGFFPLYVRKEIDAHIADRLLEAVWREGLWLINDGIATTKEIDDCISYGFGLRWAQMGLFETYRIAGGEAGMVHFIKQFGPALQWPWTKLMDVPELSEELIDKIASQSDEQSGQHTIRELERIRDENLVAMMRALKAKNWGAGELLNRIDHSLQTTPEIVDGEAAVTIRRTIPSDWTDYNGHMNDSRYGDVFSHAGDALMALTGADESYIQGGNSYFTVETKINYLQECHSGDEVFVKTRIALAEGKKLKLEHLLLSPSSEVLASCEQFLLHVDLTSRKTSEPLSPHRESREQLAQQHSKLPSLLF